MEYRKLPRGGENERFSTLGLGLGGIQNASEEEIEQTIRLAIEKGINFFDLCAGGAGVYAPFGRAIAGRREKVFFQQHFGAVYNQKGEYGWSRKLDEIRRTMDWELQTLGTDTIDLGYLHCVDEEEDAQALQDGGLLAHIQDLKAKGVVKHIGFSSHTPSVAHLLLDTGLMDMMMFSLNPAYDFDCEEGGTPRLNEDRARLFARCQAEGVGISVMKPFHAGKLLDAATSPFHKALSRFQCLQYALDRPGVLTVVPGIRSMADLLDLLPFVNASAEEKDYAVIGSFTPETVAGACVYCNHCQPCPAGIDIGLVNKYYDLALAGDAMAEDHYGKLAVNAKACLSCGHCDARCPFHVPQSARMAEIARAFG